MKNILSNQIDVEKIREFMFLNKLSIKDFCKKCNFSYNVYNKITKGSCNFKSSNLFKLARAMNVEICKLFIKI